MTTKLEAIASFKATIAHIETDIADLESFFSVTCIDAWPFVVVLNQNGHISALKTLTEDSFNMSASGRDATAFTRRNAENIAKEYGYELMGKRDFFEYALNSKRETLAFMKEMIAKHETEE